MITFIVQARTGSTRLHNKILLPFYGEQSILDLMIEKLKRVEGTRVIIATSEDRQCDPIEEVAAKHGVLCFRGSENDVLKRFVDAAVKFDAKKIIRVCSDNPFLDYDSLKLLAREAEKDNESDYVGFNINGTPSILTHFGFWTEYVTLDALQRAQKMTDEKLFHEHLTMYVYKHPEIFKVRWLEGPAVISQHTDIRLTIDTIEDFQNAQQIFADMSAGTHDTTIPEVVGYLDGHRSFYDFMKAQIARNEK